MEVVAGVDSHKATFAAAVVDLIGRPVEAEEFENEPDGYEEFLAWARSRGEVVRTGVECSELVGCRANPLSDRGGRGRARGPDPARLPRGQETPRAGQERPR